MRRHLRARSKITRQFPLILNQAGDLTNCSIPNSQFSSEGAVGLGTLRFFRMRIGNWELRIGQILPILHSAKLFFARALSAASPQPKHSFGLSCSAAERRKNVATAA